MSLIESINSILWGDWTFFLLMGAGIVFTIWTKFVQFRALGHGVNVVRGVYDDPSDPGAINHFQALSAALSATVGLGNIAGVALAIGLGGPGALFWMWIIGFLGMAIKTVEVTLAMLYRNTDDPENPHGGAMWVIDATLGRKGGAYRKLASTLAIFFCITLLISTTTGGNMFQSWNVADLSNVYFGVPKLLTGVVLAVIVGAVIIGGIKRIGQVAGRLVPMMCAVYVLAALAVIGSNIELVPEMFALIFKSAFTGTEAGGAFLGGTAGLAFAVGLRRALFSNEAGQGSAPIAHAAAKTGEAVREGVVGGLEPFIDTILICTLTGLVILTTGTWNRDAVGSLQGNVQLVERDGETVLLAPTETAALPEQPHGEPWYKGSQFFLVVEAPSSDDPNRLERRRIMASLESGPGNAIVIQWSKPPPGAQFMRDADGTAQTGIYRDFKGASLTSHAFDRAFPGLGKWLVTITAWLFAISTMISWSYYGEQGIIFIAGTKAVLPYKLVFIIMTMIAPVLVSTDRELGELADFGTGWMLWANMPIVLSMGYLAVRSMKDYFAKLDRGEFPRHK